MLLVDWQYFLPGFEQCHLINNVVEISIATDALRNNSLLCDHHWVCRWPTRHSVNNFILPCTNDQSYLCPWPVMAQTGYMTVDISWSISDWGLMSHLCLDSIPTNSSLPSSTYNLSESGQHWSDNGLSFIRCQAIILTYAGSLSIGPLGTNLMKFLSK